MRGVIWIARPSSATYKGPVAKSQKKGKKSEEVKLNVFSSGISDEGTEELERGLLAIASSLNIGGMHTLSCESKFGGRDHEDWSRYSSSSKHCFGAGRRVFFR
jgi:hypothetical protein